MATFLTFCIFIAAFYITVILIKADEISQNREYILPSVILEENVDYTRRAFIAKIRSDEQINNNNIEYSLRGSGVDEGLFSVDKTTGYIRIHGILDREITDFYFLKGLAKFTNGTPAENALDLVIEVQDQNDQTPEFELHMTGSVEELSDPDTYIVTITATDGDQKDTLYSKILYKVIQQEPAGENMFEIENSSGKIKVKMNTLDREKQETYKLVITGTDMNGVHSNPKNTPNTGTGTVIISILDVNDNVPELEKNAYEGSVGENIKNMEVVRLKVTDKDKPYTQNWEAVYTIVSGNEDGYFNITTDPKTNDGILMVSKVLDYEELNEVNLRVVIKNKAPYHKSVLNTKPIEYPINIKVLNEVEAPHFRPVVKTVSISEDPRSIDLSKAIATYKATNSDTLLTATNVRYYKGSDAGQWVSIDKKTGEIKLNKYPDREYKLLKNGTYYVTIIAITDGSSPKTATGTLAIQVQDINDNCPLLTSSKKVLCSGKSEVYVSATDKDTPPNAGPFKFKVLTNSTKDIWNVKNYNETTVILQNQGIPWLGHYTVGLEVKDRKGKFCEVQMLQVKVCTCTMEKICKNEGQTKIKIVMGIFGILALLPGVLLLMLIPVLLLLCQCGIITFQNFPYEDKSEFINYNTEGEGEDKAIPDLTLNGTSQVLLNISPDSSKNFGAAFRTNGAWKSNARGSQEDYINNQWHISQYKVDYVAKMSAGQRRHSEPYTKTCFIDIMALDENFLCNYYAMKTVEFSQHETTENSLLVSNYEYCDSVMGSFEDICSCLHNETNLDFLDDLQPQFKKLAEICCGSTVELEVSTTPKPPKSDSSSLPLESALHDDHSEATSVPLSMSSFTTQILTTNYDEMISGGNISTASVDHSPLVQQPIVYLSSPPTYILGQNHQPTMFLASETMRGVPKNSIVLVENRGYNMAVAVQNRIPNLELQQVNNSVLVDPGIGGTVVHGYSGHPESQGIVFGAGQVIDSQQLESIESVGIVQSTTPSTISVIP